MRQVNWIRRTKLQTDGTRTDVFYYEDGKNITLRSLNGMVRNTAQEMTLNLNQNCLILGGIISIMV